jgi:hypothetical protein
MAGWQRRRGADVASTVPGGWATDDDVRRAPRASMMLTRLYPGMRTVCPLSLHERRLAVTYFDYCPKTFLFSGASPPQKDQPVNACN